MSAQNSARSAIAAADQAGSSDVLENLARIGLLAYGVVHLLVAWLALQLAWGGGSNEPADQSGAMATLAEQPLGTPLLWIVGVGLVALAAWQATEALRWRRGLSAVGWQRGLLRIAGPAIVAFEPEGYDEWDPDDEPVRLRLVSTSVWRTRQVQDLDGGEVRAAPVGSGQWVLTAEGLPTLFGARVSR